MRCLNLFKRKKQIRKGPLVLTEPEIIGLKLGSGTLSINDKVIGTMTTGYVTLTPSQHRKMQKRYHTGGLVKRDEQPVILQGGGTYVPADFAFPLFDAADNATVTVPDQPYEPRNEPVHNSHEPSVGGYSGSDHGSSSHDTGYSSSYSGGSDYGSSSSYDSGSSSSFDSSGSW